MQRIARVFVRAENFYAVVSRLAVGLCLLAVCLAPTAGHADFLAGLAEPHDGRSMRATSTHRIGP
ncbi:hypothetical protein FJY63_10160, partial [Candidatus Sumerlaeota bacterium]|nr:hypothetical protein [Candidatus Sumerlaeota bacterium]